jgi:hypothetical protein
MSMVVPNVLKTYKLARVLHLKNNKIPSNLNKTKLSLLSLSGLVNQSFINADLATGDEREYYFQEGETVLSSIMEAESEGYKLNDIEIEEEQLDGMIGQREIEYKSKIILWINKQCASACETFVEKLEGLRNVTIVGENTMGALHFGNPATFELPNSKLQVTLPYRLEEYDNDAPEGIGYKPDIYLHKNATIKEIYKIFNN